MLIVNPAAQSLPDIARLPGVQLIEAHHERVLANDLTRRRVGVATDTQVTTNYLGLTGAGVTVEVNDTGVDATHPDFDTRVTGEALTDTDGHGTHCAGTIFGRAVDDCRIGVAHGVTRALVGKVLGTGGGSSAGMTSSCPK